MDGSLWSPLSSYGEAFVYVENEAQKESLTQGKRTLRSADADTGGHSAQALYADIIAVQRVEYATERAVLYLH